MSTEGFTEGGLTKYQKTYFLPKYLEGNWGEAKSSCKSFDLELVTLETLLEAKTLSLILSNYFKSSNNAYFFIDGTSLNGVKSTTDWYWTKNGKKISYPMPWLPSEPNNTGNIEYCLTFIKKSINEDFGFNDGSCLAVIKFLCQKIEYLNS